MFIDDVNQYAILDWKLLSELFLDTTRYKFNKNCNMQDVFQQQ